MASFIFEEGTQTDASGFQAGDTLVFKTATPTTLGVGFTPSTGTSTDIVTLSFGTQSLQFAQSALSNAATKTTFLVGGGTLTVGSNNAETTATLSGANASAAYLFGGNDSIVVSGTAAHVVDMGSGNDTIMVGPQGADTAVSGAYYLYGGAGADTIVAGGSTTTGGVTTYDSGNLHIYGNSRVSAAGVDDGGDSIVVGIGTNSVNGNGGNDTISVFIPVAAGGTPTDSETAGIATATAARNQLYGGNGNDFITGGLGIDSINGNLGNDSIDGGAGNDYLRGGQGNDTIIGGTGNDQLFGDLGTDSLYGGTGIDVLTGGDGNDIFYFSTADAATPPATGNFAGFTDEITDFSVGNDKINLSTVDAAGTVTAANVVYQQAGSTFANVFAAQTYAQQLIDNTTVSATSHIVAAIQVGADTYLFSNELAANGSGTINTVIKLDGVTAANFKSTDII